MEIEVIEIPEDTNNSAKLEKRKNPSKMNKKIKKKKEEELKVGINWKHVWLRQQSSSGNNPIWIRRWVKVIIEDKENIPFAEIQKETTPQIVSMKQNFPCEYEGCDKVFKDVNKLRKHLVVH